VLESELQLGQQHLEESRVGKHREHESCIALHQSLGKFLPYALGHEGVRLAVCDHGAHQRHGLRRDRKTEPRRKARHPQDPHRVLDESGAHVPEQPAFEIGRAAEGIDELPGFVAGHRV